MREDLYTVYYAGSGNEEIVGDKEIEIPGMEQHDRMWLRLKKGNY